MLNKKLVVTSALAVTVAIPGMVFGVTGTVKPAASNTAPAAGTPAPVTAAAPATVKATQEANLKKFKTAPASTVVATVGSEKITKGELDTVLYGWYAPLALDEYINYRVVQQALKKEGLQVTKADLNKKIDELKQAQFPGQDLDGVLQRMKWSRARFEAYVGSIVGVEKLTDKQIQPKASDYAEFVKARHILIRTAATPSYDPSVKAPTEEEKAKLDAEAKAKIDKILAEIKGGKSFADAAKEYSEDPGSKDKGGELGWFRKGEMVPQFSDAAFKLKPGEMSEPVKTNFGYHLILVEQTGATANDAEKAELRKQIVERERPQKMSVIGQQLREQAKIDNKLSPAIPDPRRMPMPEGQVPAKRTPAPKAPATTKPPASKATSSATPPLPPTAKTADMKKLNDTTKP